MFAKRLFTAPMAIIGQAAGAASLPFFASLYSQRRFDDFAAAVNRSVSRILAVALLLAAAMFGLAQPLVDLVLRGGALDAEAAHSTAIFFAIFTVSLPLWAAQAIYARAFYGAGETRAPMIGGTLITLLSLPFYWLFHQRFGVPGLAWASNLAILLQTAMLALLAHRRRIVPLSGLDRAELARSFAAALLSWAGILIVLHLLPRSATASSAFHVKALLTLLAGGAVWLLLALATLKLTGSRLTEQLLRRTNA